MKTVSKGFAANGKTRTFYDALWTWYDRSGRHELPWRQPEADGMFDPYKILVSEIMLQQTQVARVITKYHQFLLRFPKVLILAQAELGDVLRLWQGLGYNRRAKYLWQAAQIIQAHGAFPASEAALVALPGVGKNTAGAVRAYAYNQPAIFIETNIRTVYLHHFFRDCQNVSDNAIRDVLTQTIDQARPREFYWAVMDYGSHLKTTLGNINTASKHYVKQSAFQGSRRQLRGRILRELGNHAYTKTDLITMINDERATEVLYQLHTEGLIRHEDNRYTLG
jgi:A/G-specific adenine glycosylase